MSDPVKSAWDEVAESFSALGKAMKERYASAAPGTATTPEEEAATAAAGETAQSTAGEGAAAEDTTERGSDPTAALREAFEQLLAAGRQFSDRAATLVRDDAVKTQARQFATSLNHALEATFEQLGEEVRGFFKGRRGDDAPVDTSEHTDSGPTGEVQPPPAEPEGDVIP